MNLNIRSRMPKITKPKGAISDHVGIAATKLPLMLLGATVAVATDVKVAGRTTSEAFKLGLEETKMNALTYDVTRRVASDEILEGVHAKTMAARERYIETIRQHHPELLPDIAKHFNFVLPSEDLKSAEAARAGEQVTEKQVAPKIVTPSAAFA